MRLPRRVMSFVSLLVLALACAVLAGPAATVFDGLVPRAEAGAGGKPTITGLAETATLDEDTSLTLNFTVSDIGTGVNRLVVSSPREPRHGTVTFGGSRADRSVTYTPDANYNGADNFTVRVTDLNGGQTTQAVDVTVRPVNDPPTARNDSLPSSDEDVIRMIPFADLTGNDLVGPANERATQTLTVTAVSDPTGGTVEIVDSNVVFTPTANYSGPAGFTYTIQDSVDPALNATATASFTITALNDAPVAVDDRYGVAEDETLTVDPPGLSYNDTDTEGLGIIVDQYTQPSNGTVSDFNNNGFVYQPNPNFNGTDSFTYNLRYVEATADSPRSNYATVTITVTPANDPPVIDDDAQDDITTEATGPDGASVDFTTPTATDPDAGDTVTVTCRIGETVITSPHDFPIGETTVDCTATDTASAEDTTSFTVTVEDTTGPTITFVGGPQPGQSYAPRELPAAPTCTATDAVSGDVPCTVTGYSTETGTHTLTARAQDVAGNETVETRDYTVTDRSRATRPSRPTTEPRPTREPQPTREPRPTRPARVTETPSSGSAVTGADVVPTVVPTEVPPTPTVEPTFEPAVEPTVEPAGVDLPATPELPESPESPVV